jgi:protein-S-isoprenylcysteine O-methyltransferase Ste14
MLLTWDLAHQTLAMRLLHHAVNLIVALTLVAIGGGGVVYFYLIDTSWPRGMTVAAAIVGAAGLYWLWDEHINIAVRQ